MGIFKIVLKHLNNEYIDSIKYIKGNFSNISFYKSIYYNFKNFPLSQAIKLPILIGTKTNIKKFGKIIIPKDCYPALFCIGVDVIDLWEDKDLHTSLVNQGTIHVQGRTWINWGTKIFVGKGAKLSFGNRVKFGCKNRIICYKSISVGNDVRFSWEGQLFDTDFHFLHDIEKNKYYPRIKPVVIEDNVFIGNRCSVSKGSIITEGSVVSCCSKVGSDFSSEGKNLLIIGNPAKMVKKNIEMGNSWFPEKELEIAKLMNE